MEIKLERKDWEDLKRTAEEILRNATRDMVLWKAILKEVKCQIQTTEKAEKKNIG